MATTSSETNTVLLVVAAVLLPPLAVYLVEGISTRFWIGLVLTILAWVPGVLFALWVVLGSRTG